MLTVGAAQFTRHVDDLSGRIGAHAARPETRTRIRALITGLAAELPTRNGWTLAEHLGEPNPHGVQHLLGRATFDEDAALAELRSFVADYLADPDAVFVGDETGDVKKGSHTVGVAPQYTGTAGTTVNAQVAVYLVYATPRGHTLIDRELYLPACWTDDPGRCRAAGVPDDVAFATKPTLLGDMVERAVDAGLPASWVVADEVYGNDPKLARRLEARGLGYVLAIRSNRHLPIDAHTSRPAARIAADLPQKSWQPLSAGKGVHGERTYDWAWVHLHPRIAHKPGSAPRRRRRGENGPSGGKPRHTPEWAQMVADAEADAADSGRSWSLLVRRHRRSGELTYYLCHTPKPTPLRTLVRVVGLRWRIEEDFATSKALTGLDEHQVRRWRSWRRWTLLVLAAHAALTIATLTARRCDEAAAPAQEMVAIGSAELRHLAAAQARQVADEAFVLAWSCWRRRHQYRAQLAHQARNERLMAS